jgi:endodeoxyribonuclease RalR
MTDTEELKPCPFCGCEDIGEGEDPEGFFVACLGCDAQTGYYLEGFEQEAIQAWNRRV